MGKPVDQTVCFAVSMSKSRPIYLSVARFNHIVR